ncbi:YdcF family protein [Nocardia sp. CDC159]|uniref:YdcF family protein n=1 Tax=Nocardia pulmonis TaxID=2951408 RepID=A0A9X2E8F6_9NOCA|nr:MULTISPECIES: YdcF family protein [Nocardia]MCM6773383.1 YdcF family protein [Nocardia pulmonis]MCM6786270.1 YdcF family protein [Nocardia sp. CDC159]
MFEQIRPLALLGKAAAALALTAGALVMTTPAARAETPLLPPGFTLPGLPLTAGLGPDTAIVVLGYGLQSDGTMRPELLERLYAGYVQALLCPETPIIVTGGNPENGVTEARAMADWFTARGISPARVHIEDRAASTVQNAQYSALLMRAIGAVNAVLVTSSDHIQRAQGDFVAAGIRVVATLTPDQAPSSALPFGPR